MNKNDRLLIVTLLTIGTYLAFQYFGQQQGPSSSVQISEVSRGQAYRVPTPQELQAPLQKEIDFIDEKVKKAEVITRVKTPRYELSFTTYGGALASVSFPQRLGKESRPLRTIYPKNISNREESAFLVALDQPTPYFYTLIAHRTRDDMHELVYETQAHGFTIRKTYLVRSDRYQIGLILDFIAQDGGKKTIRPRLFFPAPFTPEVGYDVLNGISYNETKQSIEAVAADQSLETAWKMPEVFGAENRYFLHTLHGDPAHFTQRGYYKKIGAHQLFAIYEGPSIAENARFELSFFIGPKDIEDMDAVDTRLAGVLNFGWFTWLCKLLLFLLGWLYQYAHNWGFAIILLTVLIRIPLLPITIRGAQAMEKHQKLRPLVERISQQYRHDKDRRNAELVRLYHEHNLSPVGQLAGLLPLMVDLPMMVALYRVLSSYMDLYNAPFILWITDLSSKDPYYLLPVLMGASMLWIQYSSPVSDEKQRVVMMFVTLLMTGIFANFAAGLVLYWLTKNIVAIGESMFRKRALSA